MTAAWLAGVTWASQDIKECLNYEIIYMKYTSYYVELFQLIKISSTSPVLYLGITIFFIL